MNTTLLLALLSLITVQHNTQKSEETVYYVQTKNFTPELKSCFKSKLYDKWCAPDYVLRGDNPKGKSIEGIHRFLDFAKFRNKPYNTQKMLITYKSATKFSVERFVFENNNGWRRVMNLGDFQVREAGLTNKDSLCAQILTTTIISTYKP